MVEPSEPDTPASGSAELGDPVLGDVGMVGLGVMGSAMGRSIMAAGHPVVGFDIDPSRRAEFVGRAVETLAEVAERCRTIVLSLPTTESLRSVADELALSGRPRTVVIETGTFPLADKFSAKATLAEAGLELLDTPLSGTGLQAADATLVVLSSGDDAAHRRAVPIFDAIGKQTFYLGSFGNGSRMKFVANSLVAVHTLAAAEAHRLGEASGLDPEVVQEVIAPGAGGSAMFDVRGPMMVAGRFEPPAARLAIILKDVGIIADHARAVGSPTPLLDAALPVYQQGVDAGLGGLDAAALHRLLEQLSD